MSLAESLDISLQKVSTRIHFNDGEKLLSEWMSSNARVVWHVCSQPWKIEKDIIEKLSPPLNLKFDRQHPFYDYLYNLRKKMKREAEQ